MVYQQGDVLIKSVDRVHGNKLDHLTLATGEATGHHHTIVAGDAALFGDGTDLFLEIYSPAAILRHQEHKEIKVPRGKFKIEIVQEYDHFAEEARKVAD